MERTMNIHKFIVYMYGFNDECESTIKEAEQILGSSKYDFIVHTYHKNTIKIPYIEDRHILNNETLPQEVWERYIDDKLKELIKNKLQADKELETYKKKKGIE